MGTDTIASILWRLLMIGSMNVVIIYVTREMGLPGPVRLTAVVFATMFMSSILNYLERDSYVRNQ